MSGLFLAILTIAVALFFDNFLLAPGTWDSFSGGVSSWTLGRPSFLGISLAGAYAFYLFTLAVFLVAVLAVWNLSRSKTGRVLRAIRNSEIAAATSGVNVTAWKLAAFGVSAGLAGLAGGLLAPAIGSVSAGAFSFQQSLAVVAIAIVVGVRSAGAAALGGIFLIFGPELLTHTPLSTLWFPLIVGSILILQVILTPQGVVPDWQERFRKRFPPQPRFPAAPERPAVAPAARPGRGRGAHDGEGLMAPLLQADGVSMSFGGVHALSGVSFELHQGETLGLIGPNGAGKTTMFNCITGVLPGYRGEIRYDGRDLRYLKPHQRARLKIARTFQNLELFDELSALDNLVLPLDAFSRRGLIGDLLRLPTTVFEERTAEEKARSILHFIELGDYADTPAGDLPVGLQRRLEIGRALCLEPRLLLLDEPASGSTRGRRPSWRDCSRRCELASRSRCCSSTTTWR